ncbi:MAG: hypothetical protein K0R70_2629, partial [Steroidobacteraceae bacterium]|nr:hypothetical protein [Steroidobacteraceae bacterium]
MTRREERFEDPFGLRRVDTGPTVDDLQERALRGSDAPGTQFNGRRAGRRVPVTQRIVAEVPEHLVQVRRVELHFERTRRRGHVDVKAVRVDLQRLDVLAHEAAEPLDRVEAFLPRRVPSRQLQHVLDDLAHAEAVLLDDLGQVPVLGRQVRRITQQLAGVAHRADRIADFVRDARAQPPERGELRLLCAFGDDARVLQEHQRGSAADLGQRDEVRPDRRAAVGAHDLAIDVATVGVLLAPRIEQVREPRRDQRERRSGQHRRAPQQAGGRLVDESHAVELVDDEDAFTQVLDDELVQLVQVGDVEVALLDECFALAQPRGVRDREQRDREQARPGEPGDEEIRGQGVALQERDRRLQQQGERDDRGAEQRVAALDDRRGRACRKHEQRAEAARDAAARVDQHRNRDRVDRKLDHRLPGRRRRAPPDRLDAHEREREVADGGGQEQPGLVAADAARGGVEEEHQQQQHRQQQPVHVEQRKHPPGQFRVHG